MKGERKKGKKGIKGRGREKKEASTDSNLSSGIEYAFCGYIELVIKDANSDVR